MKPCSVCPQVEASASNLNSNDVFTLKTPKALFVWRGVGATDEEMAASRHVAGFLGGNPSQVAEGKEPGEPLFFFGIEPGSFGCDPSEL